MIEYILSILSAAAFFPGVFNMAWWRCCCGPKRSCAACSGSSAESTEWDIDFNSLTEKPSPCLFDENCTALNTLFTVSFYESQTDGDNDECLWLIEYDEIVYCDHFFGTYSTDRLVFRIKYFPGADETRLLVLLQLSSNTADPWTIEGGCYWERTVSGKVSCTDSWSLDSTHIEADPPDPGCGWTDGTIDIQAA